MARQKSLFPEGQDTPLFSQSPQKVEVEEFNPKPEQVQLHLGGCPICKGSGLVVPRPGAEAIYCFCEHGERAKSLDHEEGQG